MSHDVIVIGLGGMGSSASYHLASRGQRVLGLEQFTPTHDQGTSHGGSRITRQSYFEDPAHVPLLLRAHDLWERLAADSGRDLIRLCGGIHLGGPDSETFAGALRAAREWSLPHEVLCGCGPAACATPTCTTGKAASPTTSRSCSDTRRPGWWRRSAMMWPTSHLGISSC
jgi:FAD dependent oxidoreductase